MRVLNFLKESLTDFLFPYSEETSTLLQTSPEDLSQLPKAEFIKDEDIIVLFEYRHALTKRLIWEIKYKGNRELSGKMGILLSDTLEAELTERGIWNASDLIFIPIPVSPEKLFKRGFNQAELIAKALTPGKVLTNVLLKTHDTETQKQAGSRSERLKNLNNSMRVENSHLIAGKLVIVVDDVTTTGATFAEARRALKEARPRKILCLAIAH